MARKNLSGSVGNQHDWLYFRADGGMWGDGEKLRARKCSKCNNVQFFADVEQFFDGKIAKSYMKL